MNDILGLIMWAVILIVFGILCGIGYSLFMLGFNLIAG